MINKLLTEESCLDPNSQKIDYIDPQDQKIDYKISQKSILP